MIKSYTVLIFLIAIIAFNTFFTYSAFAASSDECNMFQVTFDCDLSGWMKLILGDIAIAASLALFLHYLAHRSNMKIEENSKAIKNNSESIQKILTNQQETRKRRQIYVIQSFKNHLGALLLCIGIINKFPENLVQNENNNQNDMFHKSIYKNKEFESILQRSQNTLNLSIDVIDPMLIEQIEQFLIIVEQKVSQNIQNKKPLDYDNLKNNIMQLTKRLNDYSDVGGILK